MTWVDYHCQKCGKSIASDRFHLCRPEMVQQHFPKGSPPYRASAQVTLERLNEEIARMKRMNDILARQARWMWWTLVALGVVGILNAVDLLL